MEGYTMATLKSFLERAALRYTRFSMPRPCPHCTHGETWERQLDALGSEKLACSRTATEWTPQKAQELEDVKRKCVAYRLHLKQLKTGRAETKILEKNLKVGEVMVVRDYVNHHDHNGKHVKCLHWVLLWRDLEGAELKHLKLRHYCSDPESMMTDTYFTADVMAFHFLKKGIHNPGLFDSFHRVFFIGDHGPHFACAPTMFNESKSFLVYGKEVVLMYYTSYHAYGRADGAGAEDSVSLRQDAKSDLPRLGAKSFTDMTNMSNDRRSWAYYFPKINRDQTIFPSDVNAANKHVRKWSEASFEYAGRSEHTVGICQYRLVSGKAHGYGVICSLAAERKARLCVSLARRPANRSRTILRMSVRAQGMCMRFPCCRNVNPT